MQNKIQQSKKTDVQWYVENSCLANQQPGIKQTHKPINSVAFCKHQIFKLLERISTKFNSRPVILSVSSSTLQICSVIKYLCIYTVYVNVLAFFLKCLLANQFWNSLEDKTYLSLWNFRITFLFICWAATVELGILVYWYLLAFYQ